MTIVCVIRLLQKVNLLLLVIADPIMDNIHEIPHAYVPENPYEVNPRSSKSVRFRSDDYEGSVSRQIVAQFEATTRSNDSAPGKNKVLYSLCVHCVLVMCSWCVRGVFALCL